MKRTLMLLSAAAACTTGFTQTWDELTNGGGDAGNLPGTAQITMGVGALTMITGDHQANDVDMFAINIVSAGTFSATTVGVSFFDTQLFLFDGAGMGVVMNDDDPGGAGLQSTLSSAFIPGPGIYYLAISQYNGDPSSAGGLIWENTPFNTERTPDGPGAGSPVTSWSASGLTVDTYTILLTGSEYATVPEPATFVALGIGLAGLAMLRRRK